MKRNTLLEQERERIKKTRTDNQIKLEVDRQFEMIDYWHKKKTAVRT